MMRDFITVNYPMVNVNITQLTASQKFILPPLSQSLLGDDS